MTAKVNRIPCPTCGRFKPGNQKVPTPPDPIKEPLKETLRRLKNAQDEIVEARLAICDVKLKQAKYRGIDDFISGALNYVGEASYLLRNEQELNSNGRAIKWVEGVGLTEEKT